MSDEESSGSSLDFTELDANPGYVDRIPVLGLDATWIVETPEPAVAFYYNMTYSSVAVYEDRQPDLLQLIRNEELIPEPLKDNSHMNKLKQHAQNCFKREINKAVIVVPSYLSNEDRQRLTYSARAIELEEPQLINENTAACLFYCLEKFQCRIHDEEIVLVIYSECGHFTASVIKVTGTLLQVLASHSDLTLRDLIYQPPSILLDISDRDYDDHSGGLITFVSDRITVLMRDVLARTEVRDKDVDLVIHLGDYNKEDSFHKSLVEGLQLKFQQAEVKAPSMMETQQAIACGAAIYAAVKVNIREFADFVVVDIKSDIQHSTTTHQGDASLDHEVGEENDQLLFPESKIQDMKSDIQYTAITHLDDIYPDHEKAEENIHSLFPKDPDTQHENTSDIHDIDVVISTHSGVLDTAEDIKAMENHTEKAFHHVTTGVVQEEIIFRSIRQDEHFTSWVGSVLEDWQTHIASCEGDIAKACKVYANLIIMSWMNRHMEKHMDEIPADVQTIGQFILPSVSTSTRVWREYVEKRQLHQLSPSLP